jgi:hypothetical protein
MPRLWLLLLLLLLLLFLKLTHYLQVRKELVVALAALVGSYEEKFRQIEITSLTATAAGDAAASRALSFTLSLSYKSL